MPEPPEIKAIIFDCFGVITTDPDLIFRANHVYDADIDKQLTDLANQCDRGQISESDYRKALARLTGLSVAATERQLGEIIHINQPLLSLIGKLKLSYKIGLLSNSNHNFFDNFMNQYGLHSYFDQVIVSSRAGLIKPQPEIFELTLKKLRVKNSEAIFIDDRKQNVEGANRIGLKGLLYEDLDQLKKDLKGLIHAGAA